MCIFYSCVFFFKQKTAYEMRISDWSSDVCSSDLVGGPWPTPRQGQAMTAPIRENLSGLDLRAEIDRLRKDRNAVILAHYYQKPEIQDLADFVGDSLELSRKAADTDAEVIAFCGVKFMAEKIGRAHV